jgi:hypothetical protein
VYIVSTNREQSMSDDPDFVAGVAVVPPDQALTKWQL